MDVLNYRNVCTKKPWYEVRPTGYRKHGKEEVLITRQYDAEMPEDNLRVKIKTQADFMREYYPSGHRINDPEEFPDVWKKDPETGQVFRQRIQRTAFAFQQLIAQKHILHITGNDIQMEISQQHEGKTQNDMYETELAQLKHTWIESDMEVRFFDAIQSWQTTADCAIVGFVNNRSKKTGAKVLSYIHGDTLFPQYNSITGELEVFGRKYYGYDENGNTETEWLEVWDDRYLYRFNRTVDGKTDGEYVTVIKDDYAAIGWRLVSKNEHGFPFLPVAYSRRDNGPCWAAVQSNIEDYEEAFSHLVENNKAYAFPIFYYYGEGEDLQIQGNLNGAVKAIAISDTEAKAGFLNGTDASNAFATQLAKSYDLIYELSFTVKPPELKSGDLPGVALKLLYSPAIEIAMNDAQMLQPFLSTLIKIVAFMSGYENNNTATMLSLPVNTWIKPYVHENMTEEITNLATAVQNGFLSKQTASERCPEYPKNEEYKRVIAETKEKQEQDLLMDIKRQDAQTENTIQQETALAKIDSEQGGQDVNTGRGAGRPNLSGKTWDKNGNFLGENNWDEYNAKH